MGKPLISVRKYYSTRNLIRRLLQMQPMSFSINLLTDDYSELSSPRGEDPCKLATLTSIQPPANGLYLRKPSPTQSTVVRPRLRTNLVLSGKKFDSTEIVLIPEPLKYFCACVFMGPENGNRAQ